MSVYFVACLLLLLALASKSSLAIQDSHNVSVDIDSEPCGPWQSRNRDSQECKCAKSLQDIVVCQNKPYTLKLYACYCMTYNKNTDYVVVGSCQFSCQRSKGYYFDITANTTVELNERMCSAYNRQGQLCGSCIPGYAPPAYSYSLSCVKCTTNNWAKYTAVSLLPVTVFFIIVLVFRLSATSPKLNGFIICLQLVFSPSFSRILESSLNDANKLNQERTSLKLLLSSLYGIWNLDFLRLVYTPFCLQPHTNTLQILALDYIIAVYPLLLITLSYFLVLLYDYNVHPVACLLKPFVPLFIRFRRHWNIRNSLVDTFATFLLFSYVKILSVSVDILLPVLLYDQNQNRLQQPYLFNQGDVAFLHRQHLPYACLALFFFVTFTLVPMLLLFLYPCSCFQVCLNRTGCSCQLLHTFMDTFQGHYKDGTNGTRNFRFFSGLYLLLRVLVYASTVLAYQIASYAYTTVIIAGLAICVALARPYKRHIYNVIDTCFLTVTHMLFVTLSPLSFGTFSRIEEGSAFINFLLLFVPFLYMIVLIVWWLNPWKVITKCWSTLCQRLRGEEHRLTNVSDYETLH